MSTLSITAILHILSALKREEGLDHLLTDCFLIG